MKRLLRMFFLLLVFKKKNVVLRKGRPLTPANRTTEPQDKEDSKDPHISPPPATHRTAGEGSSWLRKQPPQRQRAKPQHHTGGEERGSRFFHLVMVWGLAARADSTRHHPSPFIMVWDGQRSARTSQPPSWYGVGTMTGGVQAGPNICMNIYIYI